MEEEKVNELCVLPEVGPPWLVYTYVNNEKIQTFCTISNNNCSYNKCFPELVGKVILACCHGWLILRDFSNLKMYSLWNPFTLQSISLPQLPVDGVDLVDDDDDDEYCTLIMSDNGSQVSMVVLFYKTLVFIYRVSSMRTAIDGCWVKQRVEFDGERLDLHEIITLDKIIYGWARTENLYLWLLFSMEVADDESTSLTVKSLKMDPPRSGIGCFRSVDYWVESCGCIYYVSVFNRHGDHSGHNPIVMVKVMELDLVGRKWVEVKSLGGRAFLLGKDCSTWCWGSNSASNKNNPIQSSSSGEVGGNDSVRGDCVYFLLPDMDDAVFYSYDLHDGCLGVFLSCSNMQSRFQSPVWLNPMPQHHRLLSLQDVNGCSLTQTKENVGDLFDNEMMGIGTKYEVCLPEEKERQDGEIPRFFELPDHLINLISKYMHLFDFWNFRATCKTFQSIVPSVPQCRTNKTLPFFVFLKNDVRFCEIIDPSRTDSFSNVFQIHTDPFAIDYFKDGWLVISVGPERSLKYLNPFTRVRGDYPADVGMCNYSCIGFSTYPTSPDCLTIAVVDRFLTIEVNYIKYGNESWNGFEFPNEHGFYEFHPGTSSPVYLSETFYVLFKFGYLGAFTLDGLFKWRVYDGPKTRDFQYESSHLVECGGELHVVFIWFMGTWIEVFRLDLLIEKWFEVRSLGNYSLFLSHTSSFSVETTEVNLQNKIYFSRLKENGIVYYSFETNKYHVCGSDETMVNFYGTKEPLQCCWL